VIAKIGFEIDVEALDLMMFRGNTERMEEIREIPGVPNGVSKSSGSLTGETAVLAPTGNNHVCHNK
jgi:hypothetical protein